MVKQPKSALYTLDRVEQIMEKAAASNLRIEPEIAELRQAAKEFQRQDAAAGAALEKAWIENVLRKEKLAALMAAMKQVEGFLNNKAKARSRTQSAKPCLAQAPGQARNLRAERLPKHQIHLQWDKPLEGGAILSYRVEYRLAADEPWMKASAGADNETTVKWPGQKTAVAFRVIAENSVGPGAPSCVAMVEPAGKESHRA